MCFDELLLTLRFDRFKIQIYSISKYFFKKKNGALFSKHNINMQNIFKNGHNLTLQSELSPVYDYRTETVGRISLNFQTRY